MRKIIIIWFILIISVNCFSAEIETQIDNVYPFTGDIVSISINLFLNEDESILSKESDLQSDDISTDALINYFSFEGQDNTNILPDISIINNLSIKKGRRENKNFISFSFKFQIFEAKNFILKPISFQIQNNENKYKIETKQIYFTLKQLKFEEGTNPFSNFSLLDEQIKDIDAPFEKPFDWLFWSLIGGGALILIVIAIIIIIHIRKKKESEEIEKLKTPYEIAISELEKLKNYSMKNKEAIKEYYILLSAIIRRYLSRILKIFIMETPTKGIVKLLRKRFISPEIIEEIVMFLKQCDMVKFAKVRPNEIVNKESLSQGYNILQIFNKPTEKQEEKKG